jgi:DNA-binding NtrC family response regulator
MLNRAIHVLIVEDSEDDAYMVERQLRKQGFTPACERVQTAADMRDALARARWDLIISDYLMPEFNALGALKIYRQSGLDVPFIVVSGSIGEDVAVEAMRHGVHDYMMKDSLARLGVTVERELKEADNRRERKRLEQGVSQRLKELVSAIRGSGNLEEIHQTADEALRLIDELDTEKRRRQGAS